MVVPVLAVVGALGIIVWVNAAAAANDLEGQVFDQAGQRIQQRLTEFVEVPSQINQLNAHLIRSGILDVNDMAAWRQTLFEQIDAFTTVSSIGFATPDRNTTWMVRYPGENVYVWGLQDQRSDGLMVGRDVDSATGDVIESSENAYEYDPLVRPWYRTGLENPGRQVWSEIYPWVGQRTDVAELGLGLVLTIHDETGTLLGVHDTELSLAQISVFLSTLNISRAATVYIVDGNGGMVATSTLDPLVRSPDIRVNASDSDDPRLRAIANQLSTEPFDDDGHHDFTLETPDETLRIRIQPFKHPTGLDWSVWIVVPESDLWARTHAAQSQMIRTGVAATILVICLGFSLSLIIIRPLLRLAEQVQEIGNGNFAARSDVRLTAELTSLSTALNDMSTHLDDRLRIKQSLELAMEVQQNLLPASQPRIDGLSVFGHSSYCDETGGDYYDYFVDTNSPTPTLGIAVGDVTGHGISAALLMATARATLRSSLDGSQTLAKLLEHTNEVLVADTRGVNFMAMLLLLIDPQASTLRWASAGQTPPFVYNPNQNDFYELTSGSLPLGIIHPTQYGEQMLGSLEPGTVIVASTDGVWEAQNEDGQAFGIDRIRDVIRDASGGSAEEIGRSLIRQIERHRGRAAQDDDITFVVAKITADTDRT